MMEIGERLGRPITVPRQFQAPRSGARITSGVELIIAPIGEAWRSAEFGIRVVNPGRGH